MSPGINEAIFELADLSRVSAIGCMVRREFWASGLQGLMHLDPLRIDIGLHLDLNFPETAGRAETGLWELVVSGYLGFLAPDRLRQEIQYQFDCFEEALGRAPAFVDGHFHVHQLPAVRDELIAELKRRYPGAMPWVRSTAPPDPHWLPQCKADVIHAFGGKALIRSAQAHGIPVSGRLLGAYDFGVISDYSAALTRWLHESRSGDVLMCHPSVGEWPGVQHGAARLREYLALRATTQLAPWHPQGPTLSPLSEHFATSKQLPLRYTRTNDA